MIGISIIDCQPIEILEISFKNLKLNYVVTEEQIMNLNRIINQDLEQTSSLQVTNPTVLKQQEETYITNTNTLIQISLDSFYINNQLIDTQFPVFLAPNRKMKDDKVIPVIYVSLFSKQIKEKGQPPIQFI